MTNIKCYALAICIIILILFLLLMSMHNNIDAARDYYHVFYNG